MRWTEIAEADVSDGALRAWFRASKVVDAAGEPMLMYHGTAHLDMNFATGRLAWFTDDKTAAQSYARHRGGTDRTIVAYLRIERPARVQNILDHKPDGFDHGAGLSPENEANLLLRHPRMIEALKAAGFDGVCLPDFDMDGNDITGWATFSPNQIRRVTNE